MRSRYILISNVKVDVKDCVASAVELPKYLYSHQASFQADSGERPCDSEQRHPMPAANPRLPAPTSGALASHPTPLPRIQAQHIILKLTVQWC